MLIINVGILLAKCSSQLQLGIELHEGSFNELY